MILFLRHATLSAKTLCFRLSCCLVCPFVRPSSSVLSSGQILLPRYFINDFNNFDKADREYSLAPTDYLIRFWRSKVKVKAGRRVEVKSCEHRIS